MGRPVSYFYQEMIFIGPPVSYRRHAVGTDRSQSAVFGLALKPREITASPRRPVL